jgi:hypothetical protein
MNVLIFQAESRDFTSSRRIEGEPDRVTLADDDISTIENALIVAATSCEESAKEFTGIGAAVFNESAASYRRVLAKLQGES